MINDKRCGTCRFIVMSCNLDEHGFCDWVSQHRIDLTVPFWIDMKMYRPMMHVDRSDCDAWKPAT